MTDVLSSVRSRRPRTRVACAVRALRASPHRRASRHGGAARTVARGVRPVRALPAGFIPMLRH